MSDRHALRIVWVLGAVVVAALSYCVVVGDCALRTVDQRAFRLLEDGAFDAAASEFADPMWRGVALFREGEFEQAAGVFAGFDTPEAAFNQGTALVMQGAYEEAIARFDRALELRPGWERAVANREIAVLRAARLAREGGDMTGGMLGADEIVFSDAKSPSSDQQERTDGGKPMSDEDLRSIWLRQVTTKPSDFLRAKFAYQHAVGPAAARGDE